MARIFSKKLFATIGAVATVVMTNMGLPEDIATKITDAIVYIVGAYVLGQGAVDTAREIRSKG